MASDNTVVTAAYQNQAPLLSEHWVRTHSGPRPTLVFFLLLFCHHFYIYLSVFFILYILFDLLSVYNMHNHMEGVGLHQPPHVLE